MRNPRRWRLIAWQALGLALLLGVLALGVAQVRDNLAARGIASGFDFLLQPAGFDIGEGLIAFESTDTLARAFAVGVLNTLKVALLGIVLATALGAAVGIGRRGPNALLRGLCGAYVEVFRNVPVLVQLLVWYVALVEGLPDGAEPLNLGAGVLLSKVGLALPGWVHTADAGWQWSVPALPVDGGFAPEGGWVLSPEFLAVWLGLSGYTAAYIAEVVRGGIAAVPAGQVDAARSLGLRPPQVLRHVVGPQALRVIVPPLTNQFLNLTKNSSLAVAIGYPDVVSIANTTLNQTGRALECIALIMAVYLMTSLLTAGGMALWNRRVAGIAP